MGRGTPHTRQVPGTRGRQALTGPTAFEHQVAAEFERRGYTTEVTGGIHDWGVDVFATKGDEKLAIQAKMYGGGRPVNRRQVFELYGAGAFFRCTGCVLATDGSIREDAAEAADRLGVQILRLGSVARHQTTASDPESLDFDTVWEHSVMPLAGRKLMRPDGSSNTVLEVDWSGLARLSSGGNRQFIPIEIFRWAIERVLICGSVTRDEINERYEGRASSGIVLVLSQVPEFDVSGRPLTVRIRTRDR